MRHTGLRKEYVLRRASVAAIVLALALLFCMGGYAQDSEVVVIPSTPALGDDPLMQAYEAANTLFNDGLATMNENTLRRAAERYEQIIAEFRNDPRHFDAYFSAAYIHMEYLQLPSDYEHAKNLLSLLITSHPSNWVCLTDAHLTRAHLEYRCLRDYRAAQEDLRNLLNNAALAAELGARETDVKVLLAKCRQKLGEHEEAKRIWEEVHFSNPELDTEGRLEWINNSADWFFLDDGTVRLFFERDIDRQTYSECLAGVREGVSEVQAAWGLVPSGTIDVFLYSTSDHLFDYTLRSDGFALPIDAEIHLAVTDLPELGHLVGWVLTHRLNTRPDATVFPALRAGFNHYFLGSRQEIDTLAAHEIYYYGGKLADYELLFPLSLDYTYTSEYAAMSSSFLHHLIDNAGVDNRGLQRFYRLLRDRPNERWEPPVMARILERNLEGTVTQQEDLLTPAQLSGLFQSVLGVDLAHELEAWQASLADEIARVEAELGSISAEIRRVEVDLSTPLSALESWWAATRAGDFDAMIAASTREIAQFLSDARDYYKEQGILEQVIVDYFIRPNRSARMVVVQEGTFGETLHVFEVRIERGDEIEEKTVVVRREGNQWKVDSN